MKQLIPFTRPFLGAEEEQAVLEVLRSGWLSQGQRVAEFERRFAGYVGAEQAIAVTSCTAALHLALIVGGVCPGDEVLCPSLSFIATANSVRYVGATPVFVDIDRATYNLDPLRVEEAITSKTRAILLVHQIGMPAELDAILEIARLHNLLVIEDAACAIGSEYCGQKIGRPHGFLCCFSFHPRKILTTGEGGMITTNDEEVAMRVRRMRQHAMSISDLARHSSKEVMIETYNEVGYNYRMTDMQAAVGLVQLGRLEEFLERRRYLASRYTKKLAQVPWIQPPYEPEHCVSNFQSYMVRVAPDGGMGRDALMRAMLELGISTRRGIMAAHRELPYKNRAWDSHLPETNAATDECLILPLYHQMTEEEQDYVLASLEETVREAAL